MIQINPLKKAENVFPDSTPKKATDKFTTLDGGLVNALTLEMSPVQDLHGYSKPWAGGAGKNQLPMTVAYLKTANTTGTWSDNVYTIRGCAFTVNTDSDGNVISITVNRVSADANNPVFYVLKESYVVSESMTLNGCPSGGSTSTYRLRTTEGDNSFGSDTTIAPQTLTGVYIRIEASYDVQNVTFTPMLRLASIADPTFEPYSNICPISGHTEAKAQINDTVYTTSLGTTVYGGEVEQVSGEGESRFATVDLSTLSWTATTNHRWTTSDLNTTLKPCDNDAVTSGISELFPSLSNNALYYGEQNGIAVNPYSQILCRNGDDVNPPTGQFVYELATPTTLTLTGQNITAEVGENNVSAPLDGQEIQTDGVTYKEMFSWADVVAYVQSQVNP